MSVVSMTWRDVCFASWPVDPAVVEARLPDPLAVDAFDGSAWLSVVPFEMAEVRPAGVPRTLGLDFLELNLRTYVTAGGEPGIYFFNLDANDPLGVALARTLFRLPYYHARMTVERTGGERAAGTGAPVAPAERVDFRSERRHPGAAPLAFDATYAPEGDPTLAAPGSLDEFLVERYRFYTEGRSRLYYGDVDHARWPLYDATLDVRESDAFAANGFTRPAGDPHLRYSPGVDVRADRLRRW